MSRACSDVGQTIGGLHVGRVANLRPIVNRPSDGARDALTIVTGTLENAGEGAHPHAEADWQSQAVVVKSRKPFSGAATAVSRLNHLSVVETYKKFDSEFLPKCPIIDPRGRQIRIRKSNFPKFLNLEVRPGFTPKRPSTIVDYIEQGLFDEAEYEWARDRIQALFWVPDVLADPDAIYIKQASQGLIQAEEVYVKVYQKMGSTVKLVFVDYFGRSRDPVFITSFLTSPGTAKKHCKGKPLYLRP